MSDNQDAFRIKIFFKSGNTVIIDGVTEYGARAGGNGSIIGITMKQQDEPYQTYLDIQSLDLNSVEAIVRLPTQPAQAMETEGEDRRASGEA